jgi:hypothetical protein
MLIYFLLLALTSLCAARQIQAWKRQDDEAATARNY